MKYKVLITMIIISVLFIPFGVIKPAVKEKNTAQPKKFSSMEDKAMLKEFVNSYYFNTNDTKDWIIKIENFNISQKEYDEGYQYFMSQIPEGQKPMVDEKTIKKQYLNNLLIQYVVLIQAMQDDLFGSDDTSIVLRSAIRQAVYQIYLNRALPKDKQRFNPTEEEINKYYTQNKDRFYQMGLNADQIRQYATQELSQQKIQLWVAEYLEKLKENYRIKRNSDVLKTEGLD